MIPQLHSSEYLPPDKRPIYRVFALMRNDKVKAFWFVAEYDADKDLAFGYANLGNDEEAHWGQFYLRELREIGAVKLDLELPRPFPKVFDELKGRMGK